jgi:putative hemolysin
MNAVGRLTVVLALVSGFTVVVPAQAADNTTEGRAGLANPAAVFCVERGGEYLRGSGRCRLADGTIVDAWAYLREQHATQPGLPNPAAVFCEEHGSYDLKSGNCILPDGSVVNAWDYFRSQRTK